MELGNVVDLQITKLRVQTTALGHFRGIALLHLVVKVDVLMNGLLLEVRLLVKARASRPRVEMLLVLLLGYVIILLGLHGALLHPLSLSVRLLLFAQLHPLLRRESIVLLGHHLGHIFLVDHGLRPLHGARVHLALHELLGLSPDELHLKNFPHRRPVVGILLEEEVDEI